MTELARSDARREHSGVVTSFNAGVGLGVISTDAGDEVHFHCIEIANGTRDIEVGTQVRFSVLPKLGRWEAAAIRT